MMKGKALIFSAPSGAGKTSIVKNLVEKFTNIKFSTSVTTRNRRTNEVDGEDYYFISEENFRQHIRESDLLEWEEVYPGTFYGTLKSEVERIWQEGNTVIFDVDVKGGLRLKKHFGEKALSLFVKVPSVSILENRLRKRMTESEEILQIRVEKAKLEMQEENNFDGVILNENLGDAISSAEQVVKDFLSQ